MRFLTIGLLILGLASFSLGSDEDTSSFEDADVSLEEVRQDDSAEEQDFPEIPPEDLQEAYLEVLQDASLLDLEDAPQDFSQNELRDAMQEAFKTWNAKVKACDSDEVCLSQVNDELRPIVNQAADLGLLSVIEPCEDRVGTYEVETEDGWTIEAVLPC